MKFSCSFISRTFERLCHLCVPARSYGSWIFCRNKRDALLGNHLIKKHFDCRRHIQSKPRKSLACLCLYLLFKSHIDGCIHNIFSIYTVRTVSSTSFSLKKVSRSNKQKNTRTSPCVFL